MTRRDLRNRTPFHGGARFAPIAPQRQPRRSVWPSILGALITLAACVAIALAAAHHFGA